MNAEPTDQGRREFLGKAAVAGATVVAPGVILHAVAEADVTTAGVYQGRQDATASTFDPGELEWNTTYYWRVDEVNDAGSGSPWTGSVWSFTTADFLVIDDFETFTAIARHIRSASRSIWITVSFVDLAFRLPEAEVPFLDELDAAASRGVDVRLLFWWSEFPGIGSFRGDSQDLEDMARRGVRVKMRWDHVPRGCHHQKSYVIDGEVAYVGGINLTPDGLSTREHTTPGHHDVFAEIE